jgi:hypothetical protein
VLLLKFEAPVLPVSGEANILKIINKAIMDPSNAAILLLPMLLPQHVSIIRSSSGGRQWCTVASSLLDCNSC